MPAGRGQTEHERSLADEAERLGGQRLPPADEEGWVEETADFIEFVEEGDEVQGVLVARERVSFEDDQHPGESRMVGRFTVKTADRTVAFLGGVQLDPVLERLQLDTIIRVRYIGRVDTKGGFKVKGFKVWSRRYPAGKPGES